MAPILYWLKGSRILLSFVILLMIGCGENTSESTDSATNEGENKGSATTGKLALSIATQVENNSVEGYVVGKKENLKLIATNDGKYEIENVPAGKHDIVILANSLAISTSLSSNQNIGLRINDLIVKAGEVTSQSDIKLPPLGSITGKATLMNQSDHAGIDVYIPGTGYLAKTASDGSFTIADVPEGIHNLYIEKDGYHRGQLEKIQVTGGSQTQTAAVSLVVSTGAEGFIQAEDGSGTVSSLVVNLIIGATSNAVLMKISEDQNFTNIAWIPLATATQYTFTSDGTKTLYVKFADANGLESSPYSTTFLIDEKKWNALPTTGAPLVSDPSYIWTGSKLIVWGGNDGSTVYNTGAIYDPATQSWSAMSNASTPSARYSAACVLAGTKMVIFGGFTSINSTNSDTTGGIYDIATDSWSSLNSTGAPNFGMTTTKPLIFYANGKIIVLGTLFENMVMRWGGGIYDIATDSWTDISSTNAPSNATSPFVSGEVSGKIVMWSRDNFSHQGYIFDPATNSWTTMNLTNAPSARERPLVVSSDGKFYIWGGAINAGSWEFLQDGGIYDIANDSWTAINATNAPVGRESGIALVSSNKLFVWGGLQQSGSGSVGIVTGGIYDLSSQTWVQITSTGAPSERKNPFGAIFDDKFLVYGGSKLSSAVNTGINTGAIYTP